MDTIDITPTPAVCRQIARLFRAQQARSEDMIERASRALDALEELGDDEIGPWGRALLAAAFETLGEGENACVARLRDGLDALGPTLIPPPARRSTRRGPTMQPTPDGLDEGQRAALRRLQRAQLAEARRIRQAVADGYTLTPAHLTAPCRVAERAEARRVALWLMRTWLTWPLPTRTVAFSCTRIGRLRGGRDHATALHGSAVIAARLANS